MSSAMLRQAHELACLKHAASCTAPAFPSSSFRALSTMLRVSTDPKAEAGSSAVNRKYDLGLTTTRSYWLLMDLGRAFTSEIAPHPVPAAYDWCHSAPALQHA